MSKTRNERRRDRIENFCFGLVLIALCFAVTMWLTLMACKAWDEPVSGYDHLETIQSWGDSNAVQNG
jgi:hypothetical protein